MNNAKKFLIFTMSTVLVLIFVYLLIFRMSIGSYTKSEWWVREFYQYKEHIASNINEPKIIVASGSNSLFGINSGLLERITGYPVANLSVHGALDIEFLYYKLMDHVKEGDVVVMPIEFGVYFREYDSEWFANNMISWGFEDYLGRLPFKNKLMFVLHAPKERVVQGIVNKYFLNRSKPIPRLNGLQVRKTLRLISQRTDRGQWRGYSAESLNKYGDLNINREPTNAMRKRHRNGIHYVNFAITEHFFSVFQKISRLVEERKAKLILTWPVSMRNKHFDFSTKRTRERTKKFKGLLAKRGIDVHCNPALFNFDIRFFFNSVNHLNKKGASIRSRTLGGCINSLLNDENYQESGWADSIEIVRNMEAKFGI